MGWGETNINITFENDKYKILPQSMVHPCKLLLERRADNQTYVYNILKSHSQAFFLMLKDIENQFF
jgi:hypothetical protein